VHGKAGGIIATNPFHIAKRGNNEEALAGKKRKNNKHR
jgi:hypothetical protein